ncbi:hypothetical protein F4604DRAFT_1691644 [Suillus subluteus]|nr:hypothetical protein F4604DRAFT_1691644 [Suillus subluteus]
MCVSHSDPPGGPTSTVSTAAPQDFIRHATIEGVVVVGMRQDVSMFEMFQKEAEGVRKLMGAEVCGGIWVLLAFEERRNVRGRTGAWDVGVGEDWKSGMLAWRRTRTLAWRADTNLLDSGGPEIETLFDSTTTSRQHYVVLRLKYSIANQSTRSQINAHDRKSTHTIANQRTRSQINAHDRNGPPGGYTGKGGNGEGEERTGSKGRNGEGEDRTGSKAFTYRRISGGIPGGGGSKRP